MNNVFDEVDINPVLQLSGMLNLTTRAVKYTIEHSAVQSLLRSNIKFDLVISELAMNEAVLGMLTKTINV